MSMQMSVKRTLIQQYQAVANRPAAHAEAFRTPSEGWLRSVRKALGMSGAQLARRMGLTRARISNAEKDELRGAVTLQSMQKAAEAMGCRFVYAIVPPQTVEDLIIAQAQKKAAALVGAASAHMALKSQTLPYDKIAQEVSRLTRDFIHEMPSDFWDGK
jgi:predicted DNA-binding mobile mystery protein A